MHPFFLIFGSQEQTHKGNVSKVNPKSAYFIFKVDIFLSKIIFFHYFFFEKLLYCVGNPFLSFRNAENEV